MRSFEGSVGGRTSDFGVVDFGFVYLASRVASLPEAFGDGGADRPQRNYQRASGRSPPGPTVQQRELAGSHLYLRHSAMADRAARAEFERAVP